MEHISQQGQSKKAIPVMDLDIDDFEFKPLTKGLGFHNRKEVTSTKATVRRPSLTRANNNIELNSITLPTEVYKKNEIKKENTTSVEKKRKLKTAQMGVQLTSFAFDLALLLCFQLGLNYLFLKLANLGNLEQFILYTWIEQIVFFSFCFLFYFTILDLVASPGKKMLNLRVLPTVGKKVGIDQTMIRAVVTLLSFVLLLMPLVFDFQGKLSDTRVVEDA